jgi:hypothetical protein
MSCGLLFDCGWVVIFGIRRYDVQIIRGLAISDCYGFLETLLNVYMYNSSEKMQLNNKKPL